MNTDNINPSNTTVSSTELTDEHLDKVTGGGSKTATNTSNKGKLDTYLTFTLENTMISG